MIKKTNIYIFILLLIFIVGCGLKYTKDYEEIPSMLNILTNKVQLAVNNKKIANNKDELIKYLKSNHQNTYNWFTEHGYEINVDLIKGIAVVMICDDGKPVFEDTYCHAGAPDKDYRKSNLTSCETTMTEKEVKQICADLLNKD